MACKSLNMTIAEKNIVDEVPIIMVDRGNCSFVTKVRNVQDAGGHLALIVNNDPTEKIEDIFMADDGRGRDLVIPGVMITYEEGEILKNYYKQNKENKEILDSIRLEIDFEMENRTNIVKLDFFVNSDNEKFYKVISDLYYHLTELQEFIDLNVYYISHPSYSNQKGELKDIKNCYASGKQCHHPGKFGVKNGRDFLDEDIRQKCILNYAKEKKDIEIYLTYVNEFYEKCVNNTNFSEQCGSNIIQEHDLSSSEINKCIENSFDITEAIKAKEKSDNLSYKILAINTLLENDNNKKAENMISFLPAINVNNRNFWGSWTRDNIIEDICAAFVKKPTICYEEGYFEESSGYSFGSMFFLYIVIVLVNVLIFLICRKLIKNRIVERIESTDINHKINTVVTSYLALRDTK